MSTSQAAIKRSLHERYRQSRKNFFNHTQQRRARTRDGGGKDHNERKVWFVAPPTTYNDGLLGRKINAAMAEKIESQLRRGLK